MLTEDGLVAIDEIATEQVPDPTQPGVVALVAHADQVHVITRGAMSRGGDPMQRDTLFRISSTTKPITAVAILSLVAEGLIELDEPVDRLLPELGDRQVLRQLDGPLDDTEAAKRPITTRDLLTFTFGLGVAVEMFTAAQPPPIFAAGAAEPLCTFGPPQPGKQAEPDAWMQALGALPLAAQPGERWLYNTGASVLGVLAARAAGEPFPDVLRGRVFEPLGMNDTAMSTAETNRLPTSYAADATTIFDSPSGAWSRPPAFADGAGGLVSTADDLLAFARMFLRGGDPVLSAAAVAEMTTNQITPAQAGSAAEAFLDGGGWGYCIAIVTNGPRTGSFGWAGGLGSTWLVDPLRDLVVITLTQRMLDSPESFAVHSALQDAAYAALA
ncbi:MAG TPA: serine hydrolase domain-containing protein [Mycobacteriales bacterium]|jgi:CubicO group peptidase (beta-lactamase class C family)|nr:serine hydrolase domain-containing protein [Mycobacteriales bacterium]